MSIETVLREADRATSRPTAPPADLADRVIRQARRRRLTSAGVGVAAAVAAAIGVAAVYRPATTELTPPADPTLLAQTSDGSDRTAAQARMHELVVQRLLEGERGRRSIERAKALRAKVDPIERIDRQVEQAAFVIVAQADRKVRRWNLTDSAANDYRRVVELFPKTHWAAIARQRLASMKG